MSSAAVSKVKCGICLYEKEVFKVLHCGHKYCLDCFTNLQNGTDEKDSSDSINETITCPSCQDVTQLHDGLIDQLPTSVTYTVECFNCKGKKLTTDILWCHVCNLFVCSKCLIDKHGNFMSNTVHTAIKWDSHLTITSALASLSQKLLVAKKNSINVKFAIETYVDSLKSYLRSKVDKQLVKRETEILGVIDQFTICYSIEPAVLESCAPIEEFEKLRLILIAAANVAKLRVSVPNDAKLIAFQSVSYDYLTECLLNERYHHRCSYWEQSLAQLSTKLVETENVTPMLCQNPCDILRSDNSSSDGTILLDENQGPLGSFHKSTPVHSAKCKEKDHYGRFLRTPGYPSLMVTLCMFSEDISLDVWAFGFIRYWGMHLPNERFIECAINSKASYRERFETDKFYKPLMANENVSIFATSRNIFAVGDKTIYIYNEDSDKQDFEPFFTSDSETTCFSEIGDIVSSDLAILTFYICNNKFNRIDLLKFSDISERKMISWRQVSLAQMCPEVGIFAEPRISRLPDHGNCYLLFDRSSTKLFLWDEDAKFCKLVADLINRTFQNIVVYKDYSMYFISKDIDTDRALVHRIQL